MRITFDNATPNQSVEFSKTNTQMTREKVNNRSAEGILSPSFAMPTEYEGKGKSKNDIATAAEGMDIVNMQNAMTVMSNTMSEKDFAKACRDGINMSEVPVEDSVTILDRIKLEVSKSGEYVPGFTDDIDKEALMEMTGRYDVTVSPEMMKEIDKTYEMLSDVTQITDEMKKHFVSTSEDLTIDNLFVAKYSVAKESVSSSDKYFTLENSAYLAVKSESLSDENLDSEVRGLLEKIDVEANDKNIDTSKWLISNSLVVSKENIEMSQRIDDINLPMTYEDFSKAVSIALAEGELPQNAVIDKNESIFEQAVRITEEMQTVLESDKLDSLKDDFASNNIDLIHARRVLEEVRLSMTTEANLHLLKSGFSIDTKEMTEYVDALKKLEESATYKEAVEIKNVYETFEEIKSAPASVVEFVSTVVDADLQAIKKEGNRLRSEFEKANLTYEAVGTEVRRDLGDSIRKAFSNIDQLIKETGLEANDITRRATRILGYNNMPITRENINRIAEADNRLQTVIDKLSPKDTLDLIRQGSSPVKMSVDELSEYIRNKDNSEERDMEKYSKFLYKLEKNNEIEAEERAEYIDVYRLLHAIKKGDYAAIGAVVNSGLELTFSNLRQAVASRKHTGMDVKIDSTFGLLIDGLEDEITPERLKAVSFDENRTLSSLYDDVTKVPIDIEYENDYIKELHSQYKEAMNQPQEVVSELVNSGEVVTADTLLAAAELMKKPVKTAKKLDDILDGKLSSKGKEISEKLRDAKEGIKAVEEVTAEIKEKIYEEAMDSDKYIDVRELSLIYKQMSLTRSYAEHENYKIPVEIDGETTIANVKFVHNSEETPGVVISIESENLGRISARLTLENEKINGYIATNLKESVEKIKKVSDKISENLSVVYSKDGDSDKALSKIPTKDNKAEVSAAELYKAAQKFLDALSLIKA